MFILRELNGVEGKEQYLIEVLQLWKIWSLRWIPIVFGKMLRKT
jgi:hypothetical protein